MPNVILPAGKRDRQVEHLAEMVAGYLPTKPVKVTYAEYDKRSEDQSARFHAMCRDFAAQAKHFGRKFDTDAWKRLLVDSFRRFKHEQEGELVPSLDGNGFVLLGEQTRSMGVRRMAELIEFSQALANEMGVKSSDPKWGSYEAMA